MVLMKRRSGSYGFAIQNGEKLETELIKIPNGRFTFSCNGKLCLPVWRLCTDNVLHVINNGSGGDDDDEYSDLGGGCSDGDGEVEDDGDSGNSVGDGSNGGKDDSSDSVGEGELASITKLHL